MKRGVSGLVVGVVLGSALAGAAQGSWQSATQILMGGVPYDIFRTGYILGVNDTLNIVTTDMTPHGAAFWQNQGACLNVHSRRNGARVSSVGDWRMAVKRRQRFRGAECCKSPDRGRLQVKEGTPSQKEESPNVCSYRFGQG